MNSIFGARCDLEEARRSRARAHSLATVRSRFTSASRLRRRYQAEVVVPQLSVRASCRSHVAVVAVVVALRPCDAT